MVAHAFDPSILGRVSESLRLRAALSRTVKAIK